MAWRRARLWVRLVEREGEETWKANDEPVEDDGQAYEGEEWSNEGEWDGIEHQARPSVRREVEPRQRPGVRPGSNTRMSSTGDSAAGDEQHGQLSALSKARGCRGGRGTQPVPTPRAASPQREMSHGMVAGWFEGGERDD